MQYFPSRRVAGELIADQLEPQYRYEDCAVLALSDGAVVVGAQIAARLHAPLNLLLTETIHLQGETDAVAAIDHLGSVTFNAEYTPGQLEDMLSDSFNYLEEQKLEKLFSMNHALGQGGVVDARLLYGRTVIVVSDGLSNGLSLHAAAQYLKPIKINRLLMATPFASVSAVDQMHVLADGIICLNVMESIISVDHYYEDNTLPPHEKIIEIIEDIILNWK